MTVKEMYGGCTAEGCNNTLSRIHGLDGNVTIGELRAFLESRKSAATAANRKASEKLIQKLTGKCFKVVYSPKHTQLLLINSVHIFEQFGSVDAYMFGEKIVNYEGQLRHEYMHEGSKDTYGNHFSGSGKFVEFPVNDFIEKAKILSGLIF